MVYVATYVLSCLAMLTWVAVVCDAAWAYEVFQRRLHPTARQMSYYRQWLRATAPRGVLLLALVCVGLGAAIGMHADDPWGWSWGVRNGVFCLMTAGALALLALPRMGTALRMRKFLRCKAEQFADFAPLICTDEGIANRLEPGRFHSQDSWRSWHPIDSGFKENPLWAGMVPMVYLHPEVGRSLIVPVNFDYLLAWRLPVDYATVGELLPIWPKLVVKRVRELRGLDGWSVIHAEMEEEDEEDNATG